MGSVKSPTAISLDLGNSEKAANRNADEFAAFYRETHGLVRAVIFQIAGADSLDDLVQDAFIRIWKGLPDFRKEAEVTSWIYRIATNVAIDAVRSRSRKPLIVGDEVPDIGGPSPGPEREMVSRDLVEKGLERLSPDHRAVLVLALLHERPLGEIGEVLGVPEGTIKSRLHYAKTEFKRFLEKSGVVL